MTGMSMGWQIRKIRGKKPRNLVQIPTRCELQWDTSFPGWPGARSLAGVKREPSWAPLMAGVRENKGYWINQTQSRAWPKAQGKLVSRKRVGHRGPTRNGPPRQIQTRGPPRPTVGRWPSFVCGTAATTVIIREYWALGEVDNPNMKICLLMW